MKKVGLLFVVLVILGSFSVKDSKATQWCWQIEGSSEFIKLAVMKPDPNLPFWSLNGMWYQAGFGQTIVPLVGTMVKNADGTGRLISLYGTGLSFHPWTFTGEIDAVTKNGTLDLYDLYTDQVYYGTTPIIRVRCNSIPAP
jgi:hypothetical protein